MWVVLRRAGKREEEEAKKSMRGRRGDEEGVKRKTSTAKETRASLPHSLDFTRVGGEGGPALGKFKARLHIYIINLAYLVIGEQPVVIVPWGLLPIWGNTGPNVWLSESAEAPLRGLR